VEALAYQDFSEEFETVILSHHLFSQEPVAASGQVVPVGELSWLG